MLLELNHLILRKNPLLTNYMARRYNPRIIYRLREIPIKQIKVWKDAQARRLDREGVTELAKSIKNEGLQNPPLIQKEGKNLYLLMSGQRRLAAMKRLGAKKIPALVLTKKTEYEIKDAKAASVIENIHRKNMNDRDMASACIFLAEQMGKSKAAQSLGISMRMFRKYHGFAGVPEKLKELVPKTISRDDATKLYQIMPNLSNALKVAEKISKLDSPTRKKYLEILSKNPRTSHKKILQNAKSLVIPQKFSFKLSKGKARGLAIQSRRQDIAPKELANKIVFDWLTKKGY